MVHQEQDLEEAYRQCQSEAKAAFAREEVYVEKWIASARHVEIQVLGDGHGTVVHFGERECSLQRRHQKIVEIAPCPDISAKLREKLIQSALKMARQLNYASLGTFEFLVEGDLSQDDAPYYFIEANPRIQVEHTITEEIYGVDLVKAQLALATGASLQELQLTSAQIPEPKGFAIQARINAERLEPSGRILPTTGQIKTLALPSGKGIRIDSAIYQAYHNGPQFDSLLAKLIVYERTATFSQILAKLQRALNECHLEGLDTNLAFLSSLTDHPDLAKNAFHTRFIDEKWDELLSKLEKHSLKTFFEQSESSSVQQEEISIPAGLEAIRSPMPGKVLEIKVEVGEQIQADQALLITEAMKMESVITAQHTAVVREILVQPEAILQENQILLLVENKEGDAVSSLEEKEIDLSEIRPDLAEMLQRQAFTKDKNRPQAIEKRRKYGQRTARENIDDLCDEGSFREYGSLIIAAQRRRRKLEDLIENTPADGLISGIGSVNELYFGKEKSQCLVMAYDYTVLAGTQGALNHKKMDRLLHIAQAWKIPIVLFAEGGGGRPGDTDPIVVAGLDVMTFALFASMSGKVPRVSIVSRYCFAGNAALAGASDVIIATEDTSLGMGGPAMIEGGGLGIFHPKEVGPASFQAPNGVIDILVENEEEAVEKAKQYLAYFQGKISDWDCADQRWLRRSIPENRRRVYDIRKVIETLADTDSVLELRAHFGIGMITALVRIEGQPFGLIANNPMHLGGAIDSEGADKAARFLQLCDAFDLPVISLCDTPGIMVGPEAEKTGTVRHAARLFVNATNLSVPYFTVVLRKGYGLGAQAMAAGSFHQAFFTIAWPTGEFGAMGLEGAVRLGFRKEIEQAGDEAAQKALFEKLVAEQYERGKAINMASFMEIDQVIDPTETRAWILTGFRAARPKSSEQKNRKFIDTW